MSDTSKARAAFEADYFGDVGDCPARERVGNGYKALAVQSAWTIWQAAWTASRQQALTDAGKRCEELTVEYTVTPALLLRLIDVAEKAETMVTLYSEDAPDGATDAQFRAHSKACEAAWFALRTSLSELSRGMEKK